jgi:hypothetical protein
MAFGSIIGFIGHLNTHLVTTLYKRLVLLVTVITTQLRFPPADVPLFPTYSSNCRISLQPASFMYGPDRKHHAQPLCCWVISLFAILFIYVTIFRNLYVYS